jgi:hypothetical protein
MSNQRVELAGLELMASSQGRSMKPSPPSVAGGYKLPLHVPPQFAISWCWAQWQLTQDFIPISEQVSEALSMVTTPEAVEKVDKRGLRGDYEYAIMFASVLSGHVETMKSVAAHVHGGDGKTETNQRYQSIAGVFKSRIIGDNDEERRQLELSEKYRPDGVHPTPSRALLRAFVDRDYKAVNKEVAKGAKKHWTDQYLKGIVEKDEPDHLVINIRGKNVLFTWPYVEAAIAKLAIMDGATITHDDIWFPLDFVKAFRK